MLGLFLGAMALLAQMNPKTDFALNVNQARKKNAALMQKYSWDSRLELDDNGKVEDTRIYQVTFGPDGKLQRTLLNDQSAQMPRRFLRRAIAEEKRDKIEKYMKGLHGVLDQYTLATAGKMVDFVNAGSIQGPDANGQLTITGNNVAVPGDSLTLIVDAKTLQTKKMEVQTTFEGDVVNLTTTYKTNPVGLNYPAFAEVSIPAKNIVLSGQNYDFVRNE